MAYMVNRDAPYSGLANLMAMNGRFGDTELVHMSKPEIRGLASLGELTINPDTGLPEAFSLKAALPVIGGIAGSFLLPGIGGPLFSGVLGKALGSGLGSFAGGLLAGQPFGQAALGGLVSGGISGVMGSFAPTGSLENIPAEAALGPVESSTDVLTSGLTSGTEAVYPNTVMGQADLLSQGPSWHPDISGAHELNLAPSSIGPSTGIRLGSAYKPGILDKMFTGTENFSQYMDKTGSIPKGTMIPESLYSKLGGTHEGMSLSERGMQTLTNPTTYISGGLGMLSQEPEYEEAESFGEGFDVSPPPKFDMIGGEYIDKGPLTQDDIVRRATQGGLGPFINPYSYVRRRNEGGLVGLDQQSTRQRSNVNNFMYGDKAQDQDVFNEMFQVGQSMYQQQQPNTDVMQLAYGGQPKSNVAQMLNPTLKQNNITMDGDPDSHEDPLPVVDNLSGLAGITTAIGKGIMGISNPLSLIGTYAAQALFNQEEPEPVPDPVPFGELGNISDAISQAQAQQQAQEIAAFGNPADDTVHSTISGRGSPGTPAEFGGVGPPGGEGPSGPADPDVGDDGQGGAPWSTGGLIGLAKGGRVSPTLDYVLNVIESKGGRSDATGKKNIKDFFEMLSIIESGNKGRFKQEDVRGKDTNKKRGNNLKIGTNLAGSSAAGYFQFLNNDGIIEDYDSEFASEEEGEGFKGSSLNTAINRFKKIQELSNKSKKNNKKLSKLPAKFKKLLESRDKDISTLGYDDQFDLALANLQQAKKKTGVPGTDELLARISRGDKDAALTTYLKYHLVNEGQGKTITPKAKGIFSSLGRQPDPREYTLRGETVTDIEERLKSTPRSRMANTYRPDSQLPKREQEGPAEGMSLIERIQSILPLSEGGTIDQYFEGQVIGRGDGQSDQILFEVEGKNPDMALLSRDEYVLPADAVSMLGNGSSNAGAKELDNFVKNLRQQSFGTQQQQRQINPQRGLSALV